MTATNGRLLLHASLIFLFLAATDNAAGKLGLSEDIAIGSIVITELMPNVSDKDVDWIELLNVTDTDIDLKGCSLTDTNNDKVLIEQALTIPAGKYAILASGISDENNTPPALSKPALLYSAESFHLDNHTDQVILACSERVIDEVSYKQYQPGPASPSRGWQLEPNSLNATANDETDKWCYTVLSDDFIYGVDRAATPGAENPMCVEVSLPYVHINDQRAQSLTLLFDEHEVPTLESIVEALFRPTIVAGITQAGDGGGFARILVSTANSANEWEQSLTEQYYDPIARKYIAALVKIEPRLSHENAVWSYMFAIGVGMTMMAKTGRAGRLSGGLCDDGDADMMLSKIVPFICAGIRALTD